MENPILKAIKERRSVRKFEDKPVSEDKIEKILEAARWAPSGLNNQPWRFKVVRERETIEEISKCSKYSDTIRQADVLILIYFDAESGYDRTKDLQGIGACCQNIWLAIHAFGLGGVWNGEILNHKDCLDNILNPPDNLELMAVFCIGHPAESPTSERKPLSDLIIEDS